jgi:hypothetical protein
MSALASVLFPEPTLRRSPLAVLRWWESRRLTYNAVVGATGLFTLLVLHLVFFRLEFLLNPRPWLGALAYGVAANLCYSLGAPTEILLERWLGRRAYGLGPALFRHGLVYSVGLTLFPVALGTFITLAEFVFRVLR